MNNLSTPEPDVSIFHTLENAIFLKYPLQYFHGTMFNVNKCIIPSSIYIKLFTNLNNLTTLTPSGFIEAQIINSFYSISLHSTAIFIVHRYLNKDKIIIFSLKI